MNKILIHRSRLIIDKLAGTIPVDDETVRNRIINNMLNEGGFTVRRGLYTVVLTRMMDSQQCGYSIIDDKTKKTLLRLECNPRNDSNNFFRFELNPNKINTEEFNELFHDIFGVTFEEALESANITRIDFAVDLTGIGMSELAFTYGKHTQCRNIIEQGTTRYIGTSLGATQLCAYDKKEETKHSNNLRTTELHEDAYHEKTRVEVRLRRGAISNLQSLYEIQNPFSKVKLYSIANLKKVENITVKHLLPLLPYEGLHCVLKKISPFCRTKVRNALAERQLPCWDQDEIWSELGDALRELLDYAP